MKIIATDIKEFERLTEAIGELPKAVKDQIETVESGSWIMCNFLPAYNLPDKLTLPKGCTQITDFGEYIGFYCGKFFMRLRYEKDKKPAINYIILEQ